MANTTYFMDKNYNDNRDTTHVKCIQKIIDFSLNPVVSGNTFDALKVKAGTIILGINAVVLKADTNTSAVVTFARSVTGSGPSCAITLSANNVNNRSDADATITGDYCPVDDTIRGTVSVADTSDAKLLVQMWYTVPAAVGSI